MRTVRCKVPDGANDHDESDECESKSESHAMASTDKSSKLCQLASSHCQLTNVPRTDVDDNIDDSVTVNTLSKCTSEDSQLAHVTTTLIECCLNSRTTATTTATASVKLIDKAIPPQLIPQQRPIVTTNFNDITTHSPNNILNNTILNYSKSTFVHSHLNRTYDEANGTINLTNAFIALYTTNSDNIKLNNICSDKFSLENDSCIRHNSIECSSDMQQQHKQHNDNLNSRSCSGATLVRCFR